MSRAKPINAQLKRGRWGIDEMSYMQENAGKLPLAEMAEHLNRDSETIKRWIRENMSLDVGIDGEPVTLEENEIRNELRASPEWEELQEQFVEQELRRFEHKYTKLMSQFRNDVMPTEEMQIFHLIKFDILMDRNLKSRARAVQDINRIEKDIEDISNQYPNRKSMDDDVRNRLLNLQNQLLASQQAEQSKTTEYVKLSEKHSALMKELKGTRDQRITKAENSKKTFIELLKELQDEEIRRLAGEDMELMELAMNTERKRLSASHQYVDDTYDQPLLTPDTVGE
jgi:hypothetical protein